MRYLCVFIGGGAGAVTRYLATLCANQLASARGFLDVPAGTLLVNTVGALIIGFLAAFFDARAVPPAFRLLFITGFLGGFTTFSTYSLETAQLFLNGSVKHALLNITLHNGLCLLCTVLGIYLGKKV